MAEILTHDRIKISTTKGVLAASKGALFGGSALQSIQIGRHTPSERQQAVGFLGTVDYTSGIITSDVSLDCVLTENCTKVDDATRTNSAYTLAGSQQVAGTEHYVLTGAGVSFQSGQPATCNFSYLTAGLATYLDTQDQPTAIAGEEAQYAVVIGDDGTGIRIVATYNNAATRASGTIPIVNAAGQTVQADDDELPGGVQSIGFNASINRDQILDVRSLTPYQYVTTYPVDCRMTMTAHILPVVTGTARPGEATYDADTFRHELRFLDTLAVVAGVVINGEPAASLGKHPSTPAPAGVASADDIYAKAFGLRLTDESEGVSVDQYLSYDFDFEAGDVGLPL